MARKPMVQIESVQAVTEFNQWLRGMDETAMMLWRANVDNLAGARSRRWTTVLVMAFVQSMLVVALATFIRLGVATYSADAKLLVVGAGVLLGIATLLALRAQGREVKDARSSKMLLERKLGFLHGQLEGRDMALHLPSKRANADRLAGRAGQWPLLRPTEEMAVTAWLLHAGFLALFVTVAISLLQG